MNTPVSFEIAKLLKEKGFDEECRLCVEDGDERPLPFNCGNTIHRNSLHSYYSAPTIAEVIMWLYEKHGIWIVCSQILDIEMATAEIYWFWVAVKESEEIAYQYFDFKSPTEAYEAAIEYTLNNLI
jgi:hypothetical protein